MGYNGKKLRRGIAMNECIEMHDRQEVIQLLIAEMIETDTGVDELCGDCCFELRDCYTSVDDEEIVFSDVAGELFRLSIGYFKEEYDKHLN